MCCEGLAYKFTLHNKSVLISLFEHVIIPPVVPLVTNEIHSFVWSQIFAILFHGFPPLLIGC